jgi:hypothetical protein
LDGQLWVGEVKSKAGEFSQTEIDKLIAASKRLQADKAFLFALDGDQQSITNTCNRLKAEGWQSPHSTFSGAGEGGSCRAGAGGIAMIRIEKRRLRR